MWSPGQGHQHHQKYFWMTESRLPPQNLHFNIIWEWRPYGFLMPSLTEWALISIPLSVFSLYFWASVFGWFLCALGKSKSIHLFSTATLCILYFVLSFWDNSDKRFQETIKTNSSHVERRKILNWIYSHKNIWHLISTSHPQGELIFKECQD